METIYNEIKITYREAQDDWTFELRGRNRSAESLAKAKEAIDKTPAEKRKPFPRFEAYRLNYRGVERVTITSAAEERYGRTAPESVMFWISDKDGKRQQESARCLYPVNEHNDKVMIERGIVVKEIEALNVKLGEINGRLEMAKIPAEFAD
jgi:hypothetical protein